MEPEPQLDGKQIPCLTSQNKHRRITLIKNVHTEWSGLASLVKLYACLAAGQTDRRSGRDMPTVKSGSLTLVNSLYYPGILPSASTGKRRGETGASLPERRSEEVMPHHSIH